MLHSSLAIILTFGRRTYIVNSVSGSEEVAEEVGATLSFAPQVQTWSCGVRPQHGEGRGRIEGGQSESNA